MRYKKKSWIVENTWKCDSCGHTNKGRHMKCQNCGSPKEKHEKYDTSKNLTAPAVTDTKLLEQAKAGKNWECSYCGGSVRNLFDECAMCGGPKTESAKAKTEDGVICSVCCNPGCSGICEAPVEVRPGVRLDDTMPGLQEAFSTPTEPEREFVPNTGGYRSAPEHKKVEPAVSSYQNRRYEDDIDVSKFRSRNWKPFIVAAMILAAILSIVGLAVFIFMPHEEYVIVADTQWVYLAHLQQRESRSGSGWDETVPAGAFNESCHTRQRGTRDCNPYQCNPHQRSYSCNPHECSCHTSCSDLGNGYSSCSETCSTCYDTCYETEYDTCYEQCPVYDDWCTYNYYAWPTIHTERETGHDHNMREPILNTHPNPPAPQRVVREHRFSVTFGGEEETWTYTPESVADYNRFERGARWLIEVNHAGGVYPQHIDTDR